LRSCGLTGVWSWTLAHTTAFGGFSSLLVGLVLSALEMKRKNFAVKQLMKEVVIIDNQLAQTKL